MELPPLKEVLRIITNRQDEEAMKRIQKRINLFSILLIPATILLAATVGEILHSSIGNTGYIIGVISTPFIGKFLFDFGVQTFIMPAYRNEKISLKCYKLMDNWQFYIVPIFAIIVASVYFRGYGIYKLFRVLAGVQCAFYVTRLFQSQSNIKKAFAFCFFMLAITFFPAFGIRMSREEWQIIDLVFVALSLFTNLKFYNKDSNIW